MYKIDLDWCVARMVYHITQAALFACYMQTTLQVQMEELNEPETKN